MPTLYATEGQKKPKLSIVEVVLYNMASMLAGVASGYDVRVSNVSPLHPNLQPHSNLVINDEDDEDERLREDRFDERMMGHEYAPIERGYAHNTYHGPVRHTRPTLSSLAHMTDEKPMRFTDSPQHYLNSTMSTTSGLGSNYTTNTSGGLSSSISGGTGTQPPTPSPRRKTSITSFTDVSEINQDRDGRVGGIYVPGDYTKYSGEDSGMIPHGAYFGSNYSPYRGAEVNLGFEREYKVNNNTTTAYQDYPYESLPPPYPESIYEIAKKTPRVPQMGITAGGHRRTLSNISSTSSNINQGFRLESDELDSIYNIKHLNLHTGSSGGMHGAGGGVHHASPAHAVGSPIGTFNSPRGSGRDYENISYFQRHNNIYTTQMSAPNNEGGGIGMGVGNHFERPISLGFEHGSQTKLRSSLKKYNGSNNTGGGVGGANTNLNGAKCGSGGGTPTNPTPPDSLTSDDSSYLSAKDSSVSSQSRVRFSPETLLDLPMQGQNLDPTIPLQAATTRRTARRHTSDLNS